MEITFVADKEWNDPDVLHDMYVQQGMTVEEIADHFDVGYGCIRNKLKNHNIEISSGDTHDLLHDEDFLREKRILEGLTESEIADIIGCDQSSVNKYLDEYGITVPSCTEPLVCDSCGEEKKYMYQHWKNGSCSANNIQNPDAYIGMLMGDGSCIYKSGNPVFTVSSVRKEFIDFLVDNFDMFTSTYSYHPSERGRSNGFANSDNSNRLYVATTRAHPFFDKLGDWFYSSGKKRFPEDIKISPDVLRYWYVGDGMLKWHKRKIAYPTLTTRSESDRLDWIESIIVDATGARSSHSYDARNNNGSSKISITDQESFFDYVGDPLPGFEYKWERESYEKYDELRSL